MNSASPTVTQQGDNLVIVGTPTPPEGSQWRAEILDSSRILLRSDDMPTLSGNAQRAATSCPVNVFRDLFHGLVVAGFTGVLSVDTGYGVKRIFLSHGAVVFAGSNVIDDRLGEVLFRESHISLDDLTRSAASVTKVRKFGQVLVGNKVLTNVELWQALKLQVKQILRSVFMAEQVFCEIIPSAPSAPTEIVFAESTLDLLEEFYSYGCAFRAFLGRLNAASQVKFLIPPEKAAVTYESGTFYGDIIAMLKQEPSVQALLNSSKLIDAYTIGALLNMVNSGICKITPEFEQGLKMSSRLTPLKTKLDAHGYVLQSVKRAFVEAGVEFPIQDARTFAAKLSVDGLPAFFLDDNASFGRDCVDGLINQSQDSPERMRQLVVCVDSMIQFILQIAGDNLDFKVAQNIRQQYRSVSL